LVVVHEKNHTKGGAAVSEENNNGADVALEGFGGKVAVKNVKRVETLANIATLILVCLIAYGGYLHVAHASKQADVLEQTFKEMTAAQREQNCLIAIPESQREHKADFCKRITR
jgi:hypothetical protein